MMSKNIIVIKSLIVQNNRKIITIFFINNNHFKDRTYATNEVGGIRFYVIQSVIDVSQEIGATNVTQR